MVATRARDGQQELVRRYDEAWEDVAVTPVEYAASGGVVAVLVRLEGRTAKGADVDQLTVEWFHVEEAGIVLQRVFYWDAAALQ